MSIQDLTLPRSINETHRIEKKTNVPVLRHLNKPLLGKIHDRVHLVFRSVKVLDCKRIHGHAMYT